MLPAEGRPGRPPWWPLTEVTSREQMLWDDLWSRPQAVMWEQLGQVLEVALFVRTLAETEQPDSKVEARKLARQYMESLGLTVQGMLRNRWKIVVATEQQREEDDEEELEAPPRRSARDRMKVVPFSGRA
ncbi:hypothetical protein ACFW9O_25020 [Streptomyces sp. NPDC059499]|uniref:hypothetical protein n=1 Tax=Streptomyces sp. NPDC059499 TaxID=3346852 RepID=UPI003683292E